VQGVIRRVERALQAVVRRIRHGEQPGYPRFQGRTPYHSFTYPHSGGGAMLEGSVLHLSNIGRITLRLRRPLAGAALTDGALIQNPRCYRQAEAYLRGASAGWLAARREATGARTRSSCWPGHI
jgi:putative transposase